MFVASELANFNKLIQKDGSTEANMLRFREKETEESEREGGGEEKGERKGERRQNVQGAQSKPPITW